MLFIVCTQVNGFKYCYLILIIIPSKKFYLTHIGALTGTTTPSQNEPESNGNEGAFHIPQTLRMEPHL